MFDRHGLCQRCLPGAFWRLSAPAANNGGISGPSNRRFQRFNWLSGLLWVTVDQLRLRACYDPVC